MTESDGSTRKLGKRILTSIIIAMTFTAGCSAISLAGADKAAVLDVAPGTASGRLLAVADIKMPCAGGGMSETGSEPEQAQASASIRYSVPVVPGWNLLSFPVTANSTDVLSVLGDCGGDTAWDAVKWYDARDKADPWKSYRNGGTANDLLALDSGMGFWIRITAVGEDSALSVEGTAPSRAAIPLRAGWNLVGYPSLGAIAASAALAGVPWDRAECFRPTPPYVRQMLPSETLSAGNGYWIHVTGDCVWVVGDFAGPVVTGVKAASKLDGRASTLTLTALVSDAGTGLNDIAGAEWSSGTSAAPAGSGTAMAASDGIFNSPTEGVKASVSVTGRPTLWVRGRDSCGNWGNAASTNGDGADQIPPQVTFSTPADGSAGIPISSCIVVTFSEPMNRTSTQAAFSVKPGVSGAFSWSAGGDIMTFDPAADLAPETEYGVTILTTATDLAGNTLDGDRDDKMENDAQDKWAFSFTTDTTQDRTAPYVKNSVPQSSAAAVPINQTVTVTFSESIDIGTMAYTCTPDPSGWTVAWSDATYANDTVTFTHADFAYGTKYTFWVTAADDLAGNPLTHGPVANPWSFTTLVNPDVTGPAVTNVTAAPNPVVQGSVLTLTAIVSDAPTGNTSVAMAEWSRGANPIAAGFGTAMAASDGSYNAATEGVIASMGTAGWPVGENLLWVRSRDAANNWGEAAPTTVFVSLTDITPPQVQCNSPADGATAVAVTAEITMDFDEAMNQASTQGAFSTIPPVAGTFSWNEAGDILSFRPTSDLAYSAIYSVTMSAAATDLAGNTLDGDRDGTMEGGGEDSWSWSFSTIDAASVSRYAVCVGINVYTYQSDLPYCVNDANECRDNLAAAGYSVSLMTDASATKANILAALDGMGADETYGDYTAFTYAGHGGTSTGIYFICPADCYYLEDMIFKDELDAIFAGYQSLHQLIFFDSCNSGGMASLGSAGRLCIMAAADNQSSWDGLQNIANGVWTYYFWEYGYRLGNAGTAELEAVFNYAKPLASYYVEVNYNYTMTPQISDGYTGQFYL